MTETRGAPRGRAGFTIVEIVVAIMILTIGVLGLAGTTALLVRQVTMGQMATQRTVAVQSVIERLNGLDWDSVGTGSDSIGSYHVSWSITEDRAQSRMMQIVAEGPGVVTGSFPHLSGQVADTFNYRLLNR